MNHTPPTRGPHPPQKPARRDHSPQNDAPTPTHCTRPHCTRTQYRNGLCHTHYRHHHQTRPAGPTRTHLQTLHNHGITDQTIARTTGLNPTTITRIRTGHTHRITRRTHTLIHTSHPQPPHTPALGARRRIHALRAAGHTPTTIAHETGIHPNTIRQISNGTVTTITRRTHTHIANYFLNHQADPITRPHPTIAAHKWPLPIEWDPDHIDNPTARPETHGHTTNHRYAQYLNGQWPRKATP